MKTNQDRQTQEKILDSINEGVFTIDRDWRITAFNRAAERITGVPREKAMGRSCKEIFRTPICEKNCVLKRTIQSGRPVTNAMTHIINKDDERVAIRISTALLHDETGGIVGGVETFQDLTQLEQLRKQLERRYSYEDIIGRSPSMRSLFRILPQVGQSSSTVLIEGDSGTGKELFARAIHNLSLRKNGPFVAINCAALPDTLLESELFGYKAGAFTGANRDKPGRFAMARGGTLFLDEIGDISPALQVRLLRVLQERTIEPLGSLEPLKVNVRIIVATHRNLDRLVEKDVFRQDLLYRIRIVHLKLPRLRDRRVDIPLLVNHLVAKFNGLQNKAISGVSEEVLARLMEYDFPGNVRELENILEHAFVLCPEGYIEFQHLPPEFRSEESPVTDTSGTALTLKALEKQYIAAALNRHAGNRKRTARELGINLSTLYRKIRALNIETPPMDGRGRP